MSCARGIWPPLAASCDTTPKGKKGQGKGAIGPVGSGNSTGRGNARNSEFWTWDPDLVLSGADLTEGNMRYQANAGTPTQPKTILAGATLGSGKYYWEILSQGAGTVWIGVGPTTDTWLLGDSPASASQGYAAYQFDGEFRALGVVQTSGIPQWTTAECTLAIAVDMTGGDGNGKIWYAVNNVWQNSGDPVAGTGAVYASLPAGLAPLLSIRAQNERGTVNFGASAFTYTPPTGFVGPDA